MKPMRVSEDVKIMLDGQKYLLEKGDKITIMGKACTVNGKKMTVEMAGRYTGASPAASPRRIKKLTPSQLASQAYKMADEGDDVGMIMAIIKLGKQSGVSSDVIVAAIEVLETEAGM